MQYVPRDAKDAVSVWAQLKVMRALSDSANAKEITALVKHVSNELKVQVRRPVAILWKVSNLSKLLPLDDVLYASVVLLAGGDMPYGAVLCRRSSYRILIVPRTGTFLRTLRRRQVRELKIDTIIYLKLKDIRRFEASVFE